MKNLFVALSDVHISLKNLIVSLLVLRQGLDKARELQVPFVIGGDLNDTKAIMRSEWVQALMELFAEYGDVEIHIIDGNHDLNNKSGSKSSLAFLHLIPNVNVYHQYKEVEFNGVPFGMLPYQNKNEDFLEIINKIPVKNLVCHQGFMGAFMGDYVVDESSVDPKELHEFDIVLSGHYHKHQHVENNIMYFGSPFTVNFGEAGQEKFIWQVYQADGKIHTQPHLTQARKHVQMLFEPNVDSEMPNINEQDLVKIIMKGPKEFALSTPNLDHIVSKNITLIPDILRQSENRIDAEIANSPIKVIESYLEGAITEFDKKELKDHLWKVIANILNGLSDRVKKKVKVTKVRAENFLSFKELEYDYTSKGLTLIEGHDEDFDISTGAGKSSFLDVVCYGLFGETSKNLKADEVINRQAKKNLFVQVELETENGTMLVSRYRKHKEYENDLFFSYAGQGEPTRGKDNRETQKLLEKELSQGFDMFLRASYFTQFGSIDKFLSASDTDKKNIISEICDQQIYDEMIAALKLSFKDLKVERQTIESSHIAQSSKVDVLQGNVKDYKDNEEDFEVKKKSTIQTLENQGNSWEQTNQTELTNLGTLSGNFESDRKTRLDTALTSQTNWVTQEAQGVEQIKININNKTKQRDEYLVKSSLPEQPLFDDEVSSIKSKLDIITTLEQEAYKMNAEVHAKDKSSQSLMSDIQLAGSKKGITNCLSCFQPISEEHIEKHIKQIQLKIDNNEREVKVIQAKRSQITESTKVKGKLDTRLREIDAAKHEHTVLKSTYLQNKRVAEDLILDIGDLENSLHTRPNNPNDFIVESVKKEVNQYLSQIEQKKLEKNPFVDRISDENKRENPYTKMFHDTADKLNTEENNLLDLDSEMAAVDKKIEYTNWWKDAIHIYIKSYLTDSFLEQINTIANEKLSQMFDGILSLHISATKEDKKSIKEKITVTIFNKNEECSYNSLSGGERCRICFALNLAIRKVTNINIGFIMFDEILNGLDEVGKSQVMRVFKELESEYESVFVIDHTTEFKSLFTNNIMIRKSNGVSQVVE